MKVLFIIPARKGSKRLVGKNIKSFNGKPLVSHSIDFAKEVSSFEDSICVTTDDQEILEIAARKQVDLIIDRPSYLATESATSLEVIEHACGTALELNKDFDTIVLLQPTTPFRSKKDFAEMKKNFSSLNAAVYTSINYNIGDRKNLIYHERNSMKKTQKNNGIEGFLNGSIYFFNYNSLRDIAELNTQNTYYYVMSKKHSIDIDTIEDWEYANSFL